jgi:hypothetical protein
MNGESTLEASNAVDARVTRGRPGRDRDALQHVAATHTHPPSRQRLPRLVMRSRRLPRRTSVGLICGQCGAQESLPRWALFWSTLWCSVCHRPMGIAHSTPRGA